MKYISMKQKIATLLFVLAFGCTVAQAKIRIDDDAQSVMVVNDIKTQLSCDDKLAEEVRLLLHQIDNSIFAFVDYEGNKFNCQWHAGQFSAHLTTLTKLILKAEGAGNKDAAKILKEVLKNLNDLVCHVRLAKPGSSAMALGVKVGPVIKNFNTYFPTIEMGIDGRVQTKYKKAVNTAVYLQHLEKRLACR